MMMTKNTTIIGSMVIMMKIKQLQLQWQQQLTRMTRMIMVTRMTKLTKKTWQWRHVQMIHYRDPATFPYVCTSSVPCRKRFKTEASEKTHRRSNRCVKHKCDMCDKEVANKSELIKHKATCQEEILANAAIDHHFQHLDVGTLNCVFVNGLQMEL